MTPEAHDILVNRRDRNSGELIDGDGVHPAELPRRQPECHALAAATPAALECRRRRRRHRTSVERHWSGAIDCLLAADS